MVDTRVKQARSIAKPTGAERDHTGRYPWGRAAALGLTALFLTALSPTGLAALAAASVGGAREPGLPPPGSEPWQPLSFRAIERRTDYRLEREAGAAVLRAEANCSASGLVLRLDGVDLSHTPRLRWRWRVDRGLDVADEASRSGDDFAARVYVLFPPDLERESWWQRVRREFARRFYGDQLPGYALSYVWASRAPVGSRWRSPFSVETYVRVLRSGRADLGTWRSEEVDLVADHLRARGAPPPSPAALALMSDADQTCGRASAAYADFAFAARPEPG